MSKFAEFPLIKPLLRLAHSRRFLVAIATVISLIVVLQRPDLAQFQNTIAVTLTVLASVLIGGMTVEDAAKAQAAAPKTIAAAIAEAGNAAAQAELPASLSAVVPQLTPQFIDVLLAELAARGLILTAPPVPSAPTSQG